ncbi:MAG: hypothetical protein P9M05_05265 [Candidatus Stygibacter australis]|nr:hypothetical protein [Candidatus Stygibacter australis]
MMIIAIPLRRIMAGIGPMILNRNLARGFFSFLLLPLFTTFQVEIASITFRTTKSRNKLNNNPLGRWIEHKMNL